MNCLVTFLITALLAACASPVQPQQRRDQSNIPGEEYAIYSALIRDMFAGDEVYFGLQTKDKLLIIEDWTVRNRTDEIAKDDEAGRMKQRFPSISQEVIDDYAAKNAKSHQLTDSFDLKLKYTLAPKEKIERIFMSGPGGWREFYKQFPDSGGLIRLSRAGLNPSGNQAIVSIQHYCAAECGSGYYLLLVKNNQGWVVQIKSQAWLS